MKKLSRRDRCRMKRGVYIRDPNWILVARTYVISRSFTKVTPNRNRSSPRPCNRPDPPHIIHIYIYHPVYHFIYIYCHRDVDWAPLSLVMRNDRWMHVISIVLCNAYSISRIGKYIPGAQFLGIALTHLRRKWFGVLPVKTNVRRIYDWFLPLRMSSCARAYTIFYL